MIFRSSIFRFFQFSFFIQYFFSIRIRQRIDDRPIVPLPTNEQIIYWMVTSPTYVEFSRMSVDMESLIFALILSSTTFASSPALSFIALICDMTSRAWAISLRICDSIGREVVFHDTYLPYTESRYPAVQGMILVYIEIGSIEGSRTHLKLFIISARLDLPRLQYLSSIEDCLDTCLNSSNYPTLSRLGARRSDTTRPPDEAAG